MHSSIYEGHVLHRRTEPVLHEFRQRLFMMFVDLDELPELFDRHWLWSFNRPNIAWFRRLDYLDCRLGNLSDSIRETVREKYGVTPTGPIRLLTNFRYFGINMNPISFYYCYGNTDRIEFVVAEVTNTPWNEKQSYVFDVRSQKSSSFEMTVRKELHVSPFMDMDYEYFFRLTPPSEQLSIRIENRRPMSNGESSSSGFVASLQMQRRPLDSWSLASVLCRYPLITAQIFVAIRWQAMRLWLKNVSIHKHPNKNLTAHPHESSQK